jgi:hypothetical protein
VCRCFLLSLMARTPPSTAARCSRWNKTDAAGVLLVNPVEGPVGSSGDLPPEP